MKRFTILPFMLLTTMLLTSCEVIGGIFKAGVWSGIIIVVVVVALVLWILAKIFGRKQN
ncbi:MULTISPECIES: hypothetical protein [Sphingobacterium]|uniref:hypothetical protein n=1 Tax=Sphingobacterium TaxID=28453 RepID=UPI0013DA3C20|nr:MULTISPECIES: hypothetical protein [unclassified Sphingobacterium]